LRHLFRRHQRGGRLQYGPPRCSRAEGHPHTRANFPKLGTDPEPRLAAASPCRWTQQRTWATTERPGSAGQGTPSPTAPCCSHGRTLGVEGPRQNGHRTPERWVVPLPRPHAGPGLPSARGTPSRHSHAPAVYSTRVRRGRMPAAGVRQLCSTSSGVHSARVERQLDHRQCLCAPSLTAETQRCTCRPHAQRSAASTCQAVPAVMI
jgi:hypothetical protein